MIPIQFYKVITGIGTKHNNPVNYFFLTDANIRENWEREDFDATRLIKLHGSVANTNCKIAIFKRGSISHDRDNIDSILAFCENQPTITLFPNSHHIVPNCMRTLIQVERIT
ncbi:MAG: hypothetical protein ACHQFX_20230 [Chitinophagales bacterium]